MAFFYLFCLLYVCMYIYIYISSVLVFSSLGILAIVILDLARYADSNGLIVVKLKQDLKYRGYVYFEPVCSNVIYQALNYLKAINSTRIFPFRKVFQEKN